MQNSKKLIHLLYVPTIYCNLGCAYCYLGKQTDKNQLNKDFDRALNTLAFATDKFLASDILPFNISLHGGEVSTLPGNVLADLFRFINRHYHQHQETLVAAGFKKRFPHIKTNLYNFDKHYDLFVEHHVSISASVDLPLSLHDKYRITKRGSSTLKRTLNNIALLASYPHRKKMSAVLYQEHLDKSEEIIKDIFRLHNEVGIDMNHFNFMFGFESQLNQEKFGDAELCTRAVEDSKQVAFYEKLKQVFMGSDLELGFKKHWFDEFTPNYCTNAFNCGEKFFLLQSDGKVYSCVRGQGYQPFFYGNIFEDSVEEILQRASNNIAGIHRQQGLHDDCKQCSYLNICQTGCAFVKNQQQRSKSYTCALQKAIYRDDPAQYPAAPAANQQSNLNSYVVNMHPHLIQTTLEPKSKRLILPNDLHQAGNTLEEMIAQDAGLQQLYSNNSVFLNINGNIQPLFSQILKTTRTVNQIGAQDSVKLFIEKAFMSAQCDDLVRNTLHLQFLRDTPVVYGDEKRVKQTHTYNFEIFYNQLEMASFYGKEVFLLNLSPYMALIQQSFQPGVLNNVMVTSNYLRKYHYDKQKSNAFYHIQAINLPFQNFEFYWRQ